MRLRIPILMTGFVLFGLLVAESGAQDKDKKVSFFHPEAFLTCGSVGDDGLFKDQKDTFNVIRDESAVAWLSLKFISKESRNVKFVWYAPNGERYHESAQVTVNRDEEFRAYARVWQSIGLRDLDKLGLLGEWRVIAMLDGKPLDNEVRFILTR